MFLVLFCVLFIISILVLVTRLRKCFQTTWIKKLRGTALKFAGMGWGRVRGWRERGGEKNFNVGGEWRRFLKFGVGMGTNFCPHVMLYSPTDGESADSPPALYLGNSRNAHLGCRLTHQQLIWEDRRQLANFAFGELSNSAFRWASSIRLTCLRRDSQNLSFYI